MEESFEDIPKKSKSRNSDIKIFSEDLSQKEYLLGLIAEKYIGKTEFQ